MLTSVASIKTMFFYSSLEGDYMTCDVAVHNLHILYTRVDH